MCLEKTSLTDIELKIIELMARNHTNYEIAQKVYLSESTVKKYVSNICAKLNANGRVHASVLAVSYKLITM